MQLLADVRLNPDSDQTADIAHDRQFWASNENNVRLFDYLVGNPNELLSGTVMPSALAVLRLMASSYLVGACTGRSVALAPLRIRSTYPAARWHSSRVSGPFRPPQGRSGHSRPRVVDPEPRARRSARWMKRRAPGSRLLSGHRSGTRAAEFSVMPRSISRALSGWIGFSSVPEQPRAAGADISAPYPGARSRYGQAWKNGPYAMIQTQMLLGAVFQPFPAERIFPDGKPGDVTTWPRQALDIARPDRGGGRRPPRRSL